MKNLTGGGVLRAISWQICGRQFGRVQFVHSLAAALIDLRPCLTIHPPEEFSVICRRRCLAAQSIRRKNFPLFAGGGVLPHNPSAGRIFRYLLAAVSCRTIHPPEEFSVIFRRRCLAAQSIRRKKFSVIYRRRCLAGNLLANLRTPPVFLHFFSV